MQGFHQRAASRTEGSFQRLQCRSVNRNPGVLHLGQHTNQRQLGVGVQAVKVHSAQFLVEHWLHQHGHGRFTGSSPLCPIMNRAFKIELSACGGAVTGNAPT